MKRWSLLVAFLYSLMLCILLPAVLLAAFAPKSDFKGAMEIYIHWEWWLFLSVMGLAQAALLAVPVRIASRRPQSQGPLALTVLTSALMMSVLAIGAFFSVNEFIFCGASSRWDGLAALFLGIAVWCIWGLIFSRMSRTMEPKDFVSRLCKHLFLGSVLELLIAVPTHIVARYRGYCCAGFSTFIGISLGISVMLISFGPGIFFLFVARWRQLHPSQDADGGE